MNLHPGAALAIRRLGMTELDAARAVATGDLTSPHQFENIALFAMRITGTGASYRSGLDEYVWRDPSIYLNDEFLARCMGLPVIIEHPDKSTLDTKEFRQRIIGSIMLAYVKGDDVWGVARINDMDAARVMEGLQLSTSPAVVFRPSETQNRSELSNGSQLLVEGIPSLLDHLAICEQGVWDKGGEPTGVQTDIITGAIEMSEEEKKAAEEKARKDAEDCAEKERADRARKDAEAGDKLDKMLSKLDSMEKRMDAMDKKDSRRDGEPEPTDETVADKKRKDAEEAERREKERADASRKDSETLRKELAELRALIPARVSDDDRAAFADAQARADSVYALHGKQAPRPMDGETVIAYKCRLLSEIKGNSPAWKDVDLYKLPAEALEIADRQIRADADREGRSPAAGALSGLREIKRTDQSGRVISEFVGNGSEIWNPGGPIHLFRGLVPQSH